MAQRGEPWTLNLIVRSLWQALLMFDPRRQFRNPVMFVVYLYTLLALVLCLLQTPINGLYIAMVVWMFLILLFANLAQSLAENRGRERALNLRQQQVETTAKVIREGELVNISSNDLHKGDIVVCEVSDLIPADGIVIEGLATVDESAITGESAPVIRESGGDLCSVTTGTRVVSDRIAIRVTAEPGDSFLDRMVKLIETSKRQKSPNQISLNTFLSAFSILMIAVVVSLKFFGLFAGDGNTPLLSVIPLIAALICFLPTINSALLDTVAIAGMDRLVRNNVIAKNSRAVEEAADVDLLILDKTGTITLGNRIATAFIPAEGYSERECAEIAQLASLSDETPEGRSIVILAKNKYDIRIPHVAGKNFIAFTPTLRMSGVDILDDEGKVLKSIRKGAADAIENYIRRQGGHVPPKLKELVLSIAKKGGTPLLVASGNEVVGLVYLKDILKGGIKRRFAKLRKMGIRTLMVTGDNPLTASAIAAEAGIDDFIAEATPEVKLVRIREEQKRGRRVAMAGDGTSDAPALAQADVGVAMNTGTQASREAGNFVDLDSNPTKLIEIVEISKQLLMTRGALITFNLANNYAYFFALLPALFSTIYVTNGTSLFQKLNLMHLGSPESAILSSVIFNGLVILALLPVVYRGVSFEQFFPDALMRRHLLVFGLGGVILPFIGIKAIDFAINFLGFV